MSEVSDQSNEIPSAVQTPGRAIQQTAPGVFGARELPRQATSLATGDVVGSRFEVTRYLGASGGGISYLCLDQSNGKEVVVKVLAMPAPEKTKFEGMYEKVRLASSIQHRNLTRILGMGRTPHGEAFVAMEFVRGTTLSSILTKYRDDGRALSLRDTFTVIAHVCEALEAVHGKMCHGVLTPYNIYLDRRGVIRLGNLAFGQIAADFLAERGEGPYVDSIYVSPETIESPDLVNSAADIYSLGMLIAEMLSPRGLPSDRDDAKVMTAQVLASHPPDLMKLVMESASEDLMSRPKSVRELRDAFERIVRTSGVVLTGAPPEGGLPIEPAVHEADEDEDDLFDIPELAGLGGEPSDASSQRFLVQKDGLDYGPFVAEDVLKQLYADEIHEFTLVLDRVTQDRIELGKMLEFRAKVDAYIPKREERKRREAEARAELERKVKKGGVAVLIGGIVVGLGVLITMATLFLMQPDPEPLPMDKAFASLDFKFAPPPDEFLAVAVDSDLLNSIFNPKASEEEIVKAIKKRRKKRGKSGTTTKRQPKTAEGGTDVQEVSFTDGPGSGHILSDEEVNDVILANFGGLRGCILKELKRDSRFRGVTMKFFIRPSGTTGGVKVAESGLKGSAVADCLTSRFRSMKFPAHGGLNRGVTYPLRVQ